MNRQLEFHDETALLDRLSTGLNKRPQEVIFLVGAPLSAPLSPDSLGVPGVSGMIDLIRKEFSSDSAELQAFEKELRTSGERIYQAAFSFLQGRRGQQTANEIVCRSVLADRKPTAAHPTIDFANLPAAEAVCPHTGRRSCRVAFESGNRSPG